MLLIRFCIRAFAIEHFYVHRLNFSRMIMHAFVRQSLQPEVNVEDTSKGQAVLLGFGCCGLMHPLPN